ncbi:MAG: hypothetical protein J5827_01685 [Oscillospiraceae bacterium]|nr:hypothetical protein [Oscillospiraceae bacterium]
MAGTISGNSVRVVAVSPLNPADYPENEYSPDSRIEFVAAVTAPDKIERHALDPNADEIEVAYIPWPGRKDVPGPISSGSFINADFVNDYIDVSALADAALPVYRVAALPGADEAATAGYGKLLEWLRQEAYDFLGATDTAMTGLTESYSVPKAAYDEPAFRLDKARTRVSARPAEYQFEKRLDGACAADEDGILDLLKNDDFYAAAAKYLGITDPTVMSRTYCGNDGEISYREFLIYEASDDPVMTIYNASFRSVRLWPRGGVSGGDMINCTFNKPSAIVYAGDCTLRPYEDAVSEAVSVYGIAADDILAHDVGYYDDITPGYFIPCYRFLVDTHGQFFASAPDAPEPEIMECIDIIVPAVVL